METVTRYIDEEQTDGYQVLEAIIALKIAGLRWPLFTTDASGLYDVLLASLPEHRRQHYACRTCRRFVDDYGGLVSIASDGSLTSAVWGDVSGAQPLTRAATDLDARVRAAKVTGVFFSHCPVWGTPSNMAGPGSKYAGARWTHLSGSPTLCAFQVHDLDKAHQLATAKREEYVMLKRALDEFDVDAVRQALNVLKADSMDRGEKAVGVAEWLLGVHERASAVRGRQRDSVLWLAVADAPAGFCHVRSTMIGTLLDDVKAGLGFDAIQRRWAEKMHPLQYRRPTAPLSAGQIDAAEKLVKGMGMESALRRRFARLDEALATAGAGVLWTPSADGAKPEQPSACGVFDHLRHGDKTKAVEPSAVMTFAKFSKMLPDVLSMDFVIRHGPFYGLVTAADPEAKPVIQWDGLDGLPRNPFSWYMYAMGSSALNWCLPAAGEVRVNAVLQKPNQWQRPDLFKHHGEGALFVLEGCREGDVYKAGGGLFPEMLRADLHGIRAVVEAHSRRTAVEDKDLGTANGVCVFSGQPSVPLTFRARTRAGTTVVAIDRWD